MSAGHGVQSRLIQGGERRSLREHSCDVGSLLVIDWAPAAGTRPRALMSFTFDCGTLLDTSGVRLAADELESCAFMTPSQAQARLPHNVASRIEASLTARRTASTVYLQAGQYIE